MRLPVVLHLVGGILRLYAIAFLGPIAVAVIHGEWRDLTGFVLGGVVTLAVAVAAWRSASGFPADLATGMGLFDSLCHTFATVGAGGFSPHPRSLIGYENPAAEWVIAFFMFLAGASFALQYRVLRANGGRSRPTRSSASTQASCWWPRARSRSSSGAPICPPRRRSGTPSSRSSRS